MNDIFTRWRVETYRKESKPFWSITKPRILTDKKMAKDVVSIIHDIARK